MPVFTGGGSNVGSAEINDGAIVNADINANAAIGMSKLAAPPLETLADVTLGGVATSIDSGTFTAKTFLEVHVIIPSIASTSTVSARFNGDAGTNYEWGVFDNGGAAVNSSAQTQIPLLAGSTLAYSYFRMTIQNITALRKTYTGNGSFGNGNSILSGNWNNTASQVTQINIFATANFPAGTRLIVKGTN